MHVLRFDNPGGLMTAHHDGLLQMVEQNDDKHEAGHARLRRDFRELELQVDKGLQSLRDSHADLRQKIATMEIAPVDTGKLMMTPRMVVGIVALCISMAGTIWASNANVRAEQAATRSDVRDILTRMDAQKTASEAARELTNMQWSQLRSDVDEIKKQQKLQQLDNQDLREKILLRTK